MTIRDFSPLAICYPAMSGRDRQKATVEERTWISAISKRRDRQQQRLPHEGTVCVAMVDVFRICGQVHVETHDHDDIHGLVVMVNPSILSELRADNVYELLAAARVQMHQSVPRDH